MPPAALRRQHRQQSALCADAATAFHLRLAPSGVHQSNHPRSDARAHARAPELVGILASVDSHTDALISASAFSEAVKRPQMERFGVSRAQLPRTPTGPPQVSRRGDALQGASRDGYAPAIARLRSHDPEERAGRSRHDGAQARPLRKRGAAEPLNSTAATCAGGSAT